MKWSSLRASCELQKRGCTVSGLVRKSQTVLAVMIRLEMEGVIKGRSRALTKGAPD